MMTSTQRERLLGMILQGTSSRTACDSLSVPHSDLLAELDRDEPFRHAFICAMSQRDALSRALERHGE